jgi:hypothetical protein
MFSFKPDPKRPFFDTLFLGAVVFAAMAFGAVVSLGCQLTVAGRARGVALTTRHFPPPWSAELQPDYYVVRDADGQAERCLFKLLPQKADFPPPLRY